MLGRWNMSYFNLSQQSEKGKKMKLPREAGQQEYPKTPLFPPLWKEKLPVLLKCIKHMNNTLKFYVITMNKLLLSWVSVRAFKAKLEDGFLIHFKPKFLLTLAV